MWNVASRRRAEAGYSFTVAPLVVKDKVIIGTAGGEYGIRGFLAAFDAKTGKEAGASTPCPAPASPATKPGRANRGRPAAASIWVTGSYDPELNLTYWGIGNPGPDWNGDRRLGDNLYSDSVVALDADTGELKWHFQFTPHDEFDYDSVQVPVLADIAVAGPDAKGDALRQPQRLLLRARSRHRRVSAGQAVREGHVDHRSRREGAAAEQGAADRRGRLVYPGVQGAHQLVFAVIQPADGPLLRAGVGRHLLHVHQASGGVREGQRFTGALPGMPIRLLIPGPVVNRRRPEDGHGVDSGDRPEDRGRRRGNSR